MLGQSPIDSAPERLPVSDPSRLRMELAGAGVVVEASAGDDEKLAEIRRIYELFVAALSGYLLMPLPSWRAGEGAREN